MADEVSPSLRRAVSEVNLQLGSEPDGEAGGAPHDQVMGGDSPHVADPVAELAVANFIDIDTLSPAPPFATWPGSKSMPSASATTTS